MAGSRFNREEAAFLARAALRRETVSYGTFAAAFGYANQGCGPVLTQMGQRLKAGGLPLLPVLVVSKETGLPSADARFYRSLGLSDTDIANEQERCFSFDWTKAPFWEE